MFCKEWEYKNLSIIFCNFILLLESPEHSVMSSIYFRIST